MIQQMFRNLGISLIPYRTGLVFIIITGLLRCIYFPSQKLEVNKKYTPPETSIAPENRPSQEETSIPTIHFQVLCYFQAGYHFSTPSDVLHGLLLQTHFQRQTHQLRFLLKTQQTRRHLSSHWNEGFSWLHYKIISWKQLNKGLIFRCPKW